MKKNLSLILALVMILGSFSSVFAAVAPVETPVDAGAFLKDKGVLVGNAEGDLMLDELLARQDAVILVAQLRGMVEAALAYPGDAGYEDVKDPFYNGPLKWAKDEGLFVGRTDKVFGFDDNLTVQEYAKVLLTALGYSVGPNGGVDIAWDKALDKAEEFGILANLKDLVETDGVKRGDMALMTFNALSVMMKDGKMTLAESLKIEMPEAKELTAEVKDTENLREVVLELSNAKLADEAKLLDKNNYRVEKFKVQKVTLDGNNVIILLETPLVKNRSYDLTIRGIDRVVDKKYTFKALDNASPEVVSVEALGEYGIKVTTSEPLPTPQERDFLVDGKNVAMNVEIYGRDIILTPYYNATFGLNTETLTIKGLEDHAGYKSALKDFDLKVVNDKDAPKVTDVTVDGSVVTVTFDKDIYKRSIGAYESSRDEGNISYRSGRLDIFAKSAKKIDTNKVEYTFEESLPRRTEVTIIDVQNHSKVAMEKTTMEAMEVKNNLEPIVIDKDVNTEFYSDKAASFGPELALYPEITEGTKTLRRGRATITIEFDKDIDVKSMDKDLKFEDNNNFKLYAEKVLSRYEAANKEVMTSIKMTEDDTIEIVIDGLVENNSKDNFTYILEVRNFEDKSGNRMFTEYIDFKLTKTNNLTIDSVNVSYSSQRNETEVVLDLNRSVDRVRAEDLTGYIFTKTLNGKAYDLKDLEGEIIVDDNGKTVTLILPEIKIGEYNYLQMLDTLRDKDNNRLTGNKYFDISKAGKATALAVTEPTPVASAVTYEYLGTEVTGTLANDTISDLNNVNISVVGKKDANVNLFVYANGALVPALTQATIITATDVAQTLTIPSTPISVGQVWTIKVQVGSEEKQLIVKKLDTALVASVVYNSTIKNTAVAADVTLPAFPYGTNLSAITVADFVVEGVDNATVTDVRKVGNDLFVTVKAENGAIGTHRVTLTVAANTPPVVGNSISDPASQLATGANIVIDLEATGNVVFTDADGHALTYTVSSSDPAVATVTVTGSIVTVDPLAAGTTIITVIANDGNGGTISDTFTVTLS